MAFYILTELAEMDFDEIGAYTLEMWGETQTIKYLTELDATFDKLAQNPDLGRNRDSIRLNLLAYPVGKHMIFFQRNQEGDVKILRILGQSMDFERHL